MNDVYDMLSSVQIARNSVSFKLSVFLIRSSSVGLVIPSAFANLPCFRVATPAWNFAESSFMVFP